MGDDPRHPHFVIVINHQGDFITILDPSYGKYVSTKKQFYNLWDKNKKGGYALILAPKNDFKQEYKPNLPSNKALFDRF
ncbi:cysteine peptidase family C39 domain-containing protein [Campylobacter majalis]|uniref:cysteine peptidase family C39 domain-containing protein n=1 Tax=Campylobacter majalis TaxID=2790656 RepID=UPI003D687B6A